MRLSDLIKKGPDEEPEKKKPARARGDPGGQSPEEEAMPMPEEGGKPSEAFRLSDVVGKEVSRLAFEKSPPSRPPSGEERPAAPPPEEEVPAVFPDEDKDAQGAADRHTIAGTEVASPSPPKPKKRASVLAGPELQTEEADEPGKEGERKTEENPFRRLREKALEYLKGIMPIVSQGKPIAFEGAEDFIVECIDTPEAVEQLYSLAVSTRDSSNSMVIHLFNHAIYSLKLGLGLHWAPERLIRLGVAALIHDIGMCFVSQALRHKEGKLSEAEIQEIRKHPIHAYRYILDHYGEPFQWLAEAVYHEHERENGRGYPQGLTGNKISEYAKVIGLADVYEALTHNRPHRKRLLPYKAVQEIIQTQKSAFHQRLLKVMLEELSVFSLNSLVRLNSNAIARVVQTIHGQPLRPVVQILYDAEGNEVMDDRQISLKEFPLLYIVDSVDESELP